MNGRVKPRLGVRIIVVGPCLIFRRGLRSLLSEQPGYRVVGEAVGCEDAEKLVRRLKPHILMLDLDMPRPSAVAVLRKVATLGIPTRIIVLSSLVDRPRIVEALQLGARGIVAKDGILEHQLQSIRTVIAGQCWVNSEIILDVLEFLRKTGRLPAPVRQDGFRLTFRERQILPAVAAGRSNRDIAQEFMISEETLKHHLTHIYDKLGVSNRLELALFAINHSLLSAGSEMAVAAIA